MDTATQGSAPILTKDGAIATIQLHRPRQANRLESDDLQTLIAHFNDIATDSNIRAVILTATGKHFSAGYDLTSILETVEEDPSAEFALNPFGTMVNMLEALPQPVICALNGGIYGGATDMALACDYRLATPEVKMFMPAARLGLHYYLDGMRRYVSRLGFNMAKRLFLFAESLDAEQMLGCGFVDRIVSADSLQSTAKELAMSVAAMAPLPVRGMKTALNDIAQDRLDPLAFSRMETKCLRSSDIQEGVIAWQEKRQPRFTGK